MLLLTQKIEDISYGELMRVYAEAIRKKGAYIYPNRSANEQILLAEQDLYSYIRSMLRSGGWVAFWLVSGHYRTVLRLERFRDGLLIAGLETASEDRGCGYGTALLQAVIQSFPQMNFYSHIHKGNDISVHLHEKVGFNLIEDGAELLDGSFSYDVNTYMLSQ